MIDTVEQATTRRSPLTEIQERGGAVISEHAGWSGPAHYGDALLEYAAAREDGAALLDLSSQNCLLVSGSEAVQFLNGLITNDMKTLAENRWMPAVFPSVQGRLVASARVVHRPDGYLIDTEGVTYQRVLQTLSRFTLAGDFRVADLSTTVVGLSLQGSRAAQIVSALFGQEAAELKQPSALSVTWMGTQITIIGVTNAAGNRFDLLVEAEAAPGLWEALTLAGARPTGFEALEILRIEAGQPRYGLDMDDTNVISETNLDDAISYTKGCYIGQEIVARIKYRGHVAKKLTGVKFVRGVKVQLPATIRSVEEKEIGRITSSTFSPHLGRTIALGYVKYDYLAAGTKIRVVSGERDFPAEITELPFVRSVGEDQR